MLTIGAGSSPFVFQAYSYNLNDLNSTDLANYKSMWDQYRIDAICVRFRMISNPDAATALNTSTSNASNWFPELTCCVDHNDATNPTSNEQILQLGKKVKQALLKPNAWTYYSFHPSAQYLMYSGVVSGYSTSPTTKNPFINCDNDAVPHYGFKYSIGIPGISTNANAIYCEIQQKYSISFKGNK